MQSRPPLPVAVPGYSWHRGQQLRDLGAIPGLHRLVQTQVGTFSRRAQRSAQIGGDSVVSAVVSHLDEVGNLVERVGFPQHPGCIQAALADGEVEWRRIPELEAGAVRVFLQVVADGLRVVADGGADKVPVEAALFSIDAPPGAVDGVDLLLCAAAAGIGSWRIHHHTPVKEATGLEWGEKVLPERCFNERPFPGSCKLAAPDERARNRASAGRLVAIATVQADRYFGVEQVST